MIKVLLVEDTATFRAIIRHQLIALDMDEVIVAADGEEALRILRDREDIDLIISDWHMAPMDGLAFCAAVQETPRLKGRQLPIVFMTADAGFSDPDKRERALGQARRLGIVDILPKPFTAVQLKAALTKGIGMAL